MNKKRNSIVVRKWLGLGFVVAFIACLAMACGSDKGPVDYSKEANWAYYVESPEHEVDVFFIAPTAGSDASCNMKVNDKDYKAAFAGSIAMEKGIYDEEADFYAPYYRQVSLECYDLPEEDREQYLTKAYADVEDAFTYYMDNINDGRPYILAGFSQGGDMVKRLLKDGAATDQLVAAYAIGWNFTEEELAEYPQIKMAQAEDDLGVVISFCSEAPDYNGESILAPRGTIGINPLNWKTDGTVADKSENLGACFTDYSGEIITEVPELCGAYLDETRGTLKVTDVDVADYPGVLSFLEDGNFHLYDYQFFYRNLQENVKLRINTYLAQ